MSKEYRMMTKFLGGTLNTAILILVVFIGVFFLYSLLSSSLSPMIRLGYVEYNGVPIYVGLRLGTDIFQLKQLYHNLQSDRSFQNQSINVKLGYTHRRVKELSDMLFIPGDKYTIEILENDEAEIRREER